MAKTPTDQPAARKAKQRIDPRVKAQAALDVATRRLNAAQAKVRDLDAQRAAAAGEVGPLQAQVAYLAANPLLSGELPGQEAIAIPEQQDPAEL